MSEFENAPNAQAQKSPILYDISGFHAVFRGGKGEISHAIQNSQVGLIVRFFSFVKHYINVNLLKKKLHS